MTQILSPLFVALGFLVPAGAAMQAGASPWSAVGFGFIGLIVTSGVLACPFVSRGRQ